MRKDLLNRLFVFLASFSMLFNSLSTPLYVLAQEVSPTPEPTPEVTSTPEPTIEPTSAPTDEPSPTPIETIEPEVTLTPESTIEVSPSPTPEETVIATYAPESQPTTTAPPEENSGSDNSSSESTTTPTSEATIAEPQENGHIQAVILEDTSAVSVPVDDLAINTDGSATLQTDKADYAPTDAVLVTGSGFMAGKTYTIVISSSDDPAVTHEGRVTADSEGKIVYAYQLDGNYRPNYMVEVKSGNLVVAITTFTDSVTSVLVPISDGTYTSWDNGFDGVNETSSFSCSSSDYVRDNIANGTKESFNVSLDSIPNGSIITSIDLITYHRDENSTSTGTYQTLVIFDGIESASGSNLGPSSSSGCSGPNTQTHNVVDTVKNGSTALQIGVVKTGTGSQIRVGAIHAIITYANRDLTVTKTNNVGGNVIANSSFNWVFAITNAGTDAVSYSNNQVVLRDNLPSGPTYGSPSESTSSFTCSRTGDVLTCSASGNLSISAGGTINVTLPVIPVSAGLLTNPAVGGTCSVDPDSLIGESNETNNNCSNSVTVTSPTPSPSPTPTATPSPTPTSTPNPSTSPNPTLPSACGLDLALVIDTSSSIDDTELGVMKTAFKNFVNAFVGTPTQVAIVSFDDQAVLQSGFTADLNSLTESGGVIDGVDGSGYTNWEDALHDTHTLFTNRADKPDLIVFTSDGNPTVSNGPLSDLQDAVVEANLAKGDGIRIVTLGIGNDLTPANLVAISSADAYYASGDFDALATTVQNLVTDLCGGTINITKKVDGVVASGWTFTPSVQGGTVDPLSDVTDANGQVSFEVNPSNDSATVDVAEMVQAGYSLTDVVCTKNNQSIQPSFDLDSVNGLVVSENDIFSCTFNNHLLPQTGSISGMKFSDLNNDHLKSGGEPGLEGWTINLIKDDYGFASTLTDVNGNYTFSNVPLGTYQVCEAHQFGWLQTYPTTPVSCGTTYGHDVTIAGGENFTEKDFGNFQLGTAKVKKVMIGGTDTFNFSGDVSGSVANDGGMIWTYELLPGTYTSTEAAKSGWDLTSISCDDGNSTGDVNQRKATFNIEGGETVICTFTNTKKSHLIVQKTTIPAGDPAIFHINASSSTGGIIDGGSKQISDSTDKDYDVTPGTYTVTEIPSADWWSITGDTCQNVVVGVGETKYCEITNTKRGNIRIFKDAIPDDPENFLFDNNFGRIYPATFQLDDDSNATTPRGMGFYILPGTYSVSERAVSGWELSSAICDDGSPISAIELSYGETVICTFTNTKLGSIAGAKFEDNDANTGTTGDQTGIASWAIDLYNNCASDFSGCVFYLTTNTDVNGAYSFTNLLPGYYQVSEVLQTGWTALTSLFHNVTVDPGESEINKNFINFENVSVTACKVEDLDGDINTTDDRNNIAGWHVNLMLDGFPASPQITEEDGCYTWTNLEPGHTYGVGEAVTSGWTNLTGTTHMFNAIPSGGSDSFTFVNSRKGTMIVKKVMVGGTDSFDFTGDVAGTISSNEGTITMDNIIPGDYTAVESVKADWDLTDISCDDGRSITPSLFDLPTRSAILKVGSGETVTCTFTNTRNTGTVVLDKVTNPSGDQTDFDLEVYGYTGTIGEGPMVGEGMVSDTDTPVSVTLPTGRYGVRENNLDIEYYLSEPICVSDIRGTLPNYYDFQLQSNERVTCTFNNLKKGHLIIQKTTNPVGDPTQFQVSVLNNPGGSEMFFGPSSGNISDSTDLDVPMVGGPVTVYESYPDSFSLPAGWMQTGQIGCQGVSVAAGETKYCTFTNALLGSISGMKFNDLEADVLGPNEGDTGDPGIQGWTINLYRDNDSVWQFVTSVQTDSNGVFLFSDLEPGVNYKVAEEMRIGWAPLMPNGQGYYTVSPLRPGQNIVKMDFGNAQLGNIHGVKWNDLNGNGVEDQDEVRLGDWKIFIDGNGNQVFDENETYTFTDDDQELGWYWFADLLPGTYSVCEEHVLGWTQTTSPVCHTVELPNGPNTCTPSSQLNSIVSNSVCNFGNREELPSVTIAKSNDKSGGVNQNDTVTYTLTLENTGNIALNNIIVSDVPAGGFTYIAGSTEIGGVAAADPTISAGKLSWTISTLAAKATISISYKLLTPNDMTFGTYTNYATCNAHYRGGLTRALFVFDIIGDLMDDGPSVNCDTASSTVSRGVSQSYGGNLSPQVLGASTELPATGSATWILILAGLAGMFGVGLKIYGRKYAKN